MEIILFLLLALTIACLIFVRWAKSKKNGIYDVAIIGSGVVGSVSALALSKSLRVVVVERDKHPRHKLGESTVPTTTSLMDLISKTFDIPELLNLFRYPHLHKLGIRSWPKTHFWFGLHKEGQALTSKDEKLLETFLAPIGPDVHVVRSDFDAYLAALYPKYGIRLIDSSPVTEFERIDSVWKIKTREGPVRAKFLIDASGHGLVGRRFKTWVDPEEKQMRTNSRTIYGFFSHSGKIDLDFLGDCPGFLHKRQAGTIHHCFKGGWMWVIPFDSREVSIGLNLDRIAFPSTGEDPEVEFWKIVSRFPSMHKHLKQMEISGKFFSHGRLQKACTSIFGDGFALTPHAAAFVDPLYSTGITQSLMFVLRLVPAITKDGQLNVQYQKLEEINKVFQSELAHADRLVSSSYLTFHDSEKFDVVFQYWCVLSSIQFVQSYAHPFNANAPLLFGAKLINIAKLRNLHAAIIRGDNAQSLRDNFGDFVGALSRHEYNGTTVFSVSMIEGLIPHSFKGIQESETGLGLMKSLKNSHFEELLESRSKFGNFFEVYKSTRFDDFLPYLQSYGYGI